MEIFILIIASFITSSISAVIGMGGGIILLGIMAIFIPQGYLVIALHGIIQLFSNISRAFIFRRNIKIQLIKQFLMGAIVGVIASIIVILVLIQSFNVNSADQIKFDVLKPLIGAFIIWSLFFKRKMKSISNNSFLLAGSIGGFSSVFLGATGPLIAPFFLNKNLLKEDVIANKAICQVITHITKIPIFIYFFNVNYISEFDLLIPLILSVFIGTKLGKEILGFIPEELFKKIFRFMLFIIAIRLLLN